MEASIHTPQRLDGESFDAYQDRRIASKKAAQAIALTGPFTPRGESSRQALRNSQRQSGAMKKVAGSYGRGLRNWANQCSAAAWAERAAKRMASA